jgi:hypothetical protein
MRLRNPFCGSSHLGINRAGSAFLQNRLMKISTFQIRRAVLSLTISLSSCALAGRWQSAPTRSFRGICVFAGVGKGQSVKIKLSHNPQHGSSPVQVLWTLDSRIFRVKRAEWDKGWEEGEIVYADKDYVED